MSADEVPTSEPDWHALEVAMREALADCRIFLPSPAESAYIAAVVDRLDADRLTLAEVES